VLRIGDMVIFDGSEHRVAGMSGTSVRLAGADGTPAVVLLSHLVSSDGFATLCFRHGRWLAGRDDNREVDLTRLPEVMEAARRHIRLTRRRDPLALKSGCR
jgi:hypothetical protein